MKFKDIKPFVREGSYEINLRLGSIEDTLKEWEEEYGLELNPDFQRGHVWSEEQQIAYVEFLLRGGKTARVIYFNSPAFGDYSNQLSDTILCVDGLQRLTAVRKFINNEIKAFGYYFNEYEDKPGMGISIRFNVNTLKTRKEVLEWYLQFNSGGTIHTEEELNRVRELLEKESK